MGEQEFIRAEHINKTFSKQGKKIKAVDDVSLELYRGECFGLIGESGSGKSTLANVIAGLEKRTAELSIWMVRVGKSIFWMRAIGKFRRNTVRKGR